MNNPFDTTDTSAGQSGIEQMTQGMEDAPDTSSISGQPSVGGKKRAAPSKKVLLIILLVVLVAFGGIAAMLLSSGDSSPKPQPMPADLALTPPAAPLLPPSDGASQAPMAPAANPAAPITAPAAVAPVVAPVALPTAPAAPQAAPLATPAAPAPAVDLCEQRMRDYAVQNGADPVAYIAQNQAYLAQCKQAVAAGAK